MLKNYTTFVKKLHETPPIPPSCDTTPMPPARHWYHVEFERSRSAMTGALESLIPTTNAALTLAYGRHYGHVAITRLRDLDTSRPPLTANRTPCQPVPCLPGSHHLRHRPERRNSSGYECRHTLIVIPKGTRRRESHEQESRPYDGGGRLVKVRESSGRPMFDWQANQQQRPRKLAPQHCEPAPFTATTPHGPREPTDSGRAARMPTAFMLLAEHRFYSPTAHPSHRPTTDRGSASDSGWTGIFFYPPTANPTSLIYR